jgi:antitoxin VapB
MGMSIKNREVEWLVAQVTAMTGESKTEAIRMALRERMERLALRMPHEHRVGRLQDFLEREVWPVVPPEVLGRPLTREEEDRILGYGPEGV